MTNIILIINNLFTVHFMIMKKMGMEMKYCRYETEQQN